MMLNRILFFVRDLSLIIWLGGLIVVDFVETPARFRVTEINRQQVIAIGRRVFAAFDRLEVILSALLLVTTNI